VGLRRVGNHFNAAQIGHFEVTKYLGFFLARVKTYRYQIQQGALPLCPTKPRPLMSPLLEAAANIGPRLRQPAKESLNFLARLSCLAQSFFCVIWNNWKRIPVFA